MLDFVVDCQKLINSPYDPQLRHHLYQTYFDKSCLKPINLANKVLRDQLCETVTSHKIDDSANFTKDLLQDIRAAICDYKVWKGGVEVSYKDYIASKPATTPVLTATTVLISLF